MMIQMRSIIFALAACVAAVFLAASCASGPRRPAWIDAQGFKQVRAGIALLEIPGKSKAQQLALTDEFHLAWEKATGVASVVRDSERIAQTLNKGEEVLSTNLVIDSKFQDLGGLIWFLTAKNLETGSVIRTAKVRVTEPERIREKFAEAIQALNDD